MEVKSYIGVGELRFGDSRLNVRAILGPHYHSFRKAPGANETDAYDKLGLHLYYDENDCLEFVEAFAPSSLTFIGISLLGRQMSDVENDLKAIGHYSRRDDVGLQCDSAGIGLYAPTGIVDGVAVFRRGYYKR
jgi:hypothetical protein